MASLGCVGVVVFVHYLLGPHVQQPAVDSPPVPAGKIYAKARALFVAPSSQRLAKDVFNYLKDGMVIKAPAAGASPITTGSM